VPEDPGDDMVGAAALAGKATYIVTLDRNLLSLNGPPGIRVHRPGEFPSASFGRGTDGEPRI
jgi:predicted nucleic acid-binding protein